MSGRIVGCVAVMCAVVAPMAAHATSVEKIRNDKVVVAEVTLEPGESEASPEKLPSLVVYMVAGVAINGAPRGWNEGNVSRGEVVYLTAGTAPIENGGKTPLHFARIEFRTSGKNETWGMTGLPPSYKMLSEDRYARTYEIRIPAGAVEPQHTHHARVAVCLSGAEMEHTLPDGTKQLATLKTGDIVWREAATHAGRNLGKTELWEIVAEPK